MTAIIKWLGSRIGFYVVAGVVAALAAFGAWQMAGKLTAQAALAKEKAAHMATQASVYQRVAEAVQAQADEVSTLQLKNKEIQDAYLRKENERVAAVRAADNARKLRDKAATDAAIASATAGALAEHARTSERNIDGLEDDANKMADRALRATANSESLAATLQARRESLDARREALNAKRKSLSTQE
jgi:hypothetical protein